MSPSPSAPRMRVGQGVQRRVGVRMTFERRVMIDTDAAEPDVVAGNEAVHVEARPGAGLERGWRGS